MFRFFKSSLIVGEAAKITKTSTENSMVMAVVKQINPYFYEGRFHTMDEYFKEGDYILIYGKNAITVVPADEFFEFFAFDDEEIVDEFRPVHQIKPF